MYKFIFIQYLIWNKSTKKAADVSVRPQQKTAGSFTLPTVFLLCIIWQIFILSLLLHRLLLHRHPAADHCG